MMAARRGQNECAAPDMPRKQPILLQLDQGTPYGIARNLVGLSQAPLRRYTHPFAPLALHDLVAQIMRDVIERGHDVHPVLNQYAWEGSPSASGTMP